MIVRCHANGTTELLQVEILDTPEFWEKSDAFHLFLNPRQPMPQDWLVSLRAQYPQLADHFSFRTSGSEGKAKFIVCSRSAMLASAHAVNEHFGLTDGDHWMRPLPTFHVGGFAIHARAFLTNSQVTAMEGKWDPGAFMEKCRRGGVTVVSLVPTQVYDLVEQELTAPASLRAVIIGGGALTPELGRAARALGWPVCPSYGMTEACSQIATARPGSDAMKILPHWETRIDPSSQRLQIKGPALFSGMLHEQEGTLSYIAAETIDGWFTTNDQVEITGNSLRFRGRQKQLIKVNGELVNLSDLQARLDDTCHAFGSRGKCLLIAEQDARAGQRIVMISEVPPKKSQEIVNAFNASVAPFERIAEHRPGKLKRSPLGKIIGMDA